MTKWIWTGWIAAALTMAPLVAQKREAAESLMQTAIKKEEVDGNLPAAIEGYKKAVAAAKGNRAIAAQAMVRMAECYQKMGDAQARKVYETILRDYADQKEATAIARAQLSRNGESRPTNASFRHVWTMHPGAHVRVFERVSPNGRYFPYDQDRDLYLHDLITGLDRRLTNTATAGGPGMHVQETDGETAFSPDSNQLAYTWWNEKGLYEIRVVDLRGTGVPQYRRLFGGEDVEWLMPAAWSPDGKWIVASVERKDGTTRLDLVSALDGSSRILRKMEWRARFITSAAFTPDGKYVAFDAPASQQNPQNDIFVIAADGSQEIRAVAHPANDSLAGWSPDGRRLLFTSNRTGHTDLWALPFDGGKPQGEPELIKTGVDLQSSFGITDSGSLYSVVSRQNPTDIKVATADFANGTFTSPPISIVAGNNRAPEWSADGKYLVYVSASPASSVVIGVHSVETGQTRELRPKLARILAPHWSPDGRSFVAWARDLDLRWGIYRIDSQNGDVTRELAAPIPDNSDPYWSSDGKSIYYRRAFPETKDAAFIERDIASGKEREIVRRRSLGNIKVSPDGRFIATMSVDPTGKFATIVLISVQKGEFRELLRLPLEEFGGLPGWARDSRLVFVRATSTAAKQERGLVQLGIDGSIVGKPVRLDPTADWVKIHPDGQRIAFQTATPANGSGAFDEVWVLENFLPSITAKK